MSVGTARHILAHICYATLATATSTGIPWSSPVYTAFDSDFHFYWISSCQARHSQNIKENSQIAFVIYDSTVREGTGTGVYIEANAWELVEPQDIAHGLRCLSERAGDSSSPPLLDEKTSQLRVYKAEVQAAWINMHVSIDGEGIDTRLPVDLHKREYRK